jgi:hypothetical protein
MDGYSGRLETHTSAITVPMHMEYKSQTDSLSCTNALSTSTKPNITLALRSIPPAQLAPRCLGNFAANGARKFFHLNCQQHYGKVAQFHDNFAEPSVYTQSQQSSTTLSSILVAQNVPTALFLTSGALTLQSSISMILLTVCVTVCIM